MTRRTVVHVIGSLDRGGAEMVALGLVRAIDPMSVRQVFLCFSGRRGTLAPLFEQEGADVLVVPGRSQIQRLTALRRLFRVIAPQVVISHISLASGAVLAIAWSAGVPSRTARFHSQHDGRHHTVARRLYRLLGRAAVALFATRILGVTPSALRFGGGRTPDPRGKSHVLGNGVDTDAFYPSGEKRVGPIRVLHVGRASLEKNRGALVPTFQEMTKLARTKWTVVGGNSLDDLGSLPPRDFVALPDTDRIPALMREHDVLILPSRWEGLPTVVLEAAASGLPIVASDLQTIRDVAGYLDGLFLVPVDAPPQRWAHVIIEAAAYGRENAASIRQRFLQSPFTLSRNVREWEAIFRDG